MSEPVITRKYSLSEIDQMRKNVKTMEASLGTSYVPASEEHIEMRLRTYMMAGVEPEELSKKAEHRRKALHDWFENHASHAVCENCKHKVSVNTVIGLSTFQIYRCKHPQNEAYEKASETRARLCKGKLFEKIEATEGS